MVLESEMKMLKNGNWGVQGRSGKSSETETRKLSKEKQIGKCG